jgi:hypothetical protein
LSSRASGKVERAEEKFDGREHNAISSARHAAALDFLNS